MRAWILRKLRNFVINFACFATGVIAGTAVVATQLDII